MNINSKRIYEQADEDDGVRILVDRLWPRGFTKERANIDLWVKEIAPSNELRQWFSHEPAKWEEFKERYCDELKGKAKEVSLIRKQLKKGPVTFVYSAKDTEHNQANVLKEFFIGR